MAFHLQAVCQPFERLGYPLTRNINPFEQLGDPSVKNISPFEQLGYPFVEGIRPFEQLGYRSNDFITHLLKTTGRLNCLVICIMASLSVHTVTNGLAFPMRIVPYMYTLFPPPSKKKACTFNAGSSFQFCFCTNILIEKPFQKPGRKT